MPSPFLIFLDFESCSLRSPCGWDDPISLYMIKTDQDLSIIDELDVRFAPTGDWSLESEKIHKIPESEARSYPPQGEGLEKIINFCDEGTTLVFHALKVGHYFDYGMMLALFEKHDKREVFYKLFPNFISTVNLLRDAVRLGKLEAIRRTGSDGKQRPTYKLDFWCERLGVKLEHHNSKSDTEACYEIFKHVSTLTQSGKTPNHSDTTTLLL